MIVKILVFKIVLTTKRIQELCQNESNFNFVRNFNVMNIQELYNISEKGGRGSFGQIYKIYSPYADSIVAIKEISINSQSPLYLTEKEISILSELTHNQNFFKYYGCFYTNNISSVFIIQEKLDDSLFEVLETFRWVNRKKRYKEYINLFTQLKEIHEIKPRPNITENPSSLVHLDIKPENIMSKGKITKLDKDQDTFTLKLIDFGLLSQTGQEMSQIGTPGYMHPSLYSTAIIRPEFDIYSMMITICQTEYGIQFCRVGNNNCFRYYNRECHDSVLMSAYVGHCQRYMQGRVVVSEFRDRLRASLELGIECLDVICMVFRALRMDVGLIGDAEEVIRGFRVLERNLDRVLRI